MVIMVDADAFLGHILKEVKEISWGDVRKIKSRLETVNRSLIIESDGKSFDRAIHYYPQLFEQVDGGVRRAKGHAHLYRGAYVRNVFPVERVVGGLLRDAIKSLKK